MLKLGKCFFLKTKPRKNKWKLDLTLKYFFCKVLETKKKMQLSPKPFPQNHHIWRTPIISLYTLDQAFLRELWAGHRGTNFLKDNSDYMAPSSGRCWKSEVKKLKSYSLLPAGWISLVKILKVSILPTVICKKYPQSIPGKIFSTFSGTKIQKERCVQLNALTVLKKKVCFFSSVITEIPQIIPTLPFPNDNTLMVFTETRTYI